MKLLSFIISMVASLFLMWAAGFVFHIFWTLFLLGWSAGS